MPPPVPWSWTASGGKGGPCGHDGAKVTGLARSLQVKGRVSPQGLILQRQIVTDTGGRLLRVHVHPANVHDRWGGKALLEGLELRHWPRVRKVYVDFGYRGLRREAEGLGLELEYEYHPEVTEAWMYLGMIRLLVKRLASAA